MNRLPAALTTATLALTVALTGCASTPAAPTTVTTTARMTTTTTATATVTPPGCAEAIAHAQEAFQVQNDIATNLLDFAESILDDDPDRGTVLSDRYTEVLNPRLTRVVDQFFAAAQTC